MRCRTARVPGSGRFLPGKGRCIHGLWLLAGCLAVGAAPLAADEAGDYTASIEAWHAHRMERLDSDTGWLTIAGFFWLREGDNAFGADSSSVVILPVGPAHAGTIRLQTAGDTTSIMIEPAAGTALTVNDEPVTGPVRFYDPAGDPIMAGLDRVAFWIIPRHDGYAVRLRDPQCPLRTSFPGIETYPIDPAYRVDARLDPAPHKVLVPNIMGYEDSLLTPGGYRFNLLGEDLELFPVIEDEADSVLFFIFNDATSGIETYGGGRFLYADRKADGTAVLDFNKAYNPPCSFNPYATCPLPPAENKLPLAVRAGEKAIPGGH
jgi:uncharacterized protein (DUF1684 family)